MPRLKKLLSSKIVNFLFDELWLSFLKKVSEYGPTTIVLPSLSPSPKAEFYFTSYEQNYEGLEVEGKVEV